MKNSSEVYSDEKIPLNFPVKKKTPSVIMDELWERIESRFERLEAQNEILRKDLEGLRHSSSQEISFNLMEAKTLREEVEEIQFDVKSLNEKLTNVERNQGVVAEMFSKKTFGPSSRFVDGGVTEEESHPEEKFEVTEIRSKTLGEEKNWLRGKFNEMREKGATEEGASFWGRTLETISNSVHLRNRETSCVLKMSNHLNVPLTDRKLCYWLGTKMTGPSIVASLFSEVFVGSGTYCNFLCSFSISDTLRMVLYCGNNSYGGIYFFIGFVPQNVPTDPDLYGKLLNMELSPDICRNEPFGGTDPAELFITIGKFRLRGHMRSDGRQALVEIDIFEIADTDRVSLRNTRAKTLSSSLKRTVETISKSLRRNEDLSGSVSCSVEIYNILNVTLQSEEPFFVTNNRYNFIPSQVQPYEGATFFASDDTCVIGMFSIEIGSTDLCLVVGLKVQGKENDRFAGAFLPCPAPSLDKRELEKLMDENHWKSHEWRKSAQPKEGEQLLQIRNIRAVVSLMKGRKSLLKIIILAF